MPKTISTEFRVSLRCAIPVPLMFPLILSSSSPAASVHITQSYIAFALYVVSSLKALVCSLLSLPPPLNSRAACRESLFFPFNSAPLVRLDSRAKSVRIYVGYTTELLQRVPVTE